MYVGDHGGAVCLVLRLTTVLISRGEIAVEMTSTDLTLHQNMFPSRICQCRNWFGHTRRALPCLVVLLQYYTMINWYTFFSIQMVRHVIMWLSIINAGELSHNPSCKYRLYMTFDSALQLDLFAVMGKKLTNKSAGLRRATPGYALFWNRHRTKGSIWRILHPWYCSDFVGLHLHSPVIFWTSVVH